MLLFSRIFGCFIKYSTWRPISRNFSNKETLNHSGGAIFLSTDGATIVCWHPPRTVPYASTRPFPRDLESLRAPASPLNIKLDKMMVEKQGGPTVLELTKAFGLPWQHFRPRPFTKKSSPYSWAPLRERKAL
ncbi:hypothetical protein X801_10799 [Opisthorchis viverrini]|uniref:Uncharacterized protein n=2 Tax=Opisthorchis viverrini TaxID=6198 RepID=A0A074ZTL6_OPIVI|nr:hypothetical protein T265_02842 [Opisthorchis viverrini]KER30803.1 hypothetical protein T265_02842 [Opisthorchis viverrini]OON13425.1 hypothetical protein X801_10799 [Opisthorchis viverrini]